MSQITHHLWSAVDYIRQEYDVSYAELIGVLEIVKQDIYNIGVEDEDTTKG